MADVRTRTFVVRWSVRVDSISDASPIGRGGDSLSMILRWLQEPDDQQDENDDHE
jgi:hypothetical protein